MDPCIAKRDADIAMDAMPAMLSQQEPWRADGAAMASCIHGKNSNAQANAQERE